MNRVLLSTSAFSLLLTPMFLHAAPDDTTSSSVNFGYLTGLVSATQSLLNLLIPLIVTVAVILFFWGLALFIMNAGDEEARKKGRNIMIWGIVALFVIVAVWGLVGVLANIFGVEQGGSAKLPSVVE